MRHEKIEVHRSGRTEIEAVTEIVVDDRLEGSEVDILAVTVASTRRLVCDETTSGPERLANVKRQLLQTVSGKGWWTIPRFYNPLPPFFDESWRSGELTKFLASSLPSHGSIGAKRDAG